MIKKVKTKKSVPGRSSVEGSKVEKSNILSIFSGSDEDSTENSKAFDNPQEERGYNSNEGAKTPDAPLADVPNPGRAGATWANPNFKSNTGQIKQKPREQLSQSSFGVSEKANRPLSKTSTQDGSITNLGNVSMSRAVVEKYPQANNVARSNSSYPADFRSEMAPMKNGLNAESFSKMAPIKNDLFQSVTEVNFEKSDEIRKNLREQSTEHVGKMMNPDIQADTLNDQAKTAIPSDFLTSSDISSENVYSSYSSSMGVYGSGEFPETKDSSSKIGDASKKAGYDASPQRAADGISKTEGKADFKGNEITPMEANTDMSIKDKVMSASSTGPMSEQQAGTTSLGESSKSFFLSNFSGVPGSITSGMDESSISTDTVSSTKFPESL
jgi:hypothetical protein